MDSQRLLALVAILGLLVPSLAAHHGTSITYEMDKTITVLLETSRPHPVYGKTVRASSKLHAHDERNEANEGDLVRVVECRPLSKQKRWRLVEILERAR